MILHHTDENNEAGERMDNGRRGKGWNSSPLRNKISQYHELGLYI